MEQVTGYGHHNGRIFVDVRCWKKPDPGIMFYCRFFCEIIERKWIGANSRIFAVLFTFARNL